MLLHIGAGSSTSTHLENLSFVLTRSGAYSKAFISSPVCNKSCRITIKTTSTTSGNICTVFTKPSASVIKIAHESKFTAIIVGPGCRPSPTDAIIITVIIVIITVIIVIASVIIVISIIIIITIRINRISKK